MSDSNRDSASQAQCVTITPHPLLYGGAHGIRTRTVRILSPLSAANWTTAPNYSFKEKNNKETEDYFAFLYTVLH